MKKILLIVTAIALALTLCAGCNTGSRTVDDDFDDDPEPIVIGDTSDDNSGDKPDDNTNVDDDKTDDDSDDNSNVDDDKSDGDYPEGWPVDDLPPGFPVYPNGEINDLSGEDYIFIVIHNTDQDTFEGYKAELEAWGFEFGELSPAGIYTGFTDDWEVGLSSTDTMVGINLKPNN